VSELTPVQREADAYLEGAMERLKEALEKAFPGDVYKVRGNGRPSRGSTVDRTLLLEEDDWYWRLTFRVGHGGPSYDQVHSWRYRQRGFERLRAISRLLPDIMDTLARICAKEEG
jgi:hypothetical protein